jgi:hypothetical protein
VIRRVKQRVPAPPHNPIGLLTEQDIARLANAIVADIEWVTAFPNASMAELISRSIRTEMEIETGDRLAAESAA